jgi:Putative adhesin
MKSDKTLQVAREESFDIERPEVSVLSISTEITVVESQDGKSHVRILADSKKAMKLAEMVEIDAVDRKLTIRVDKKTWSVNTSLPLDMKNQNFWGLNFGGLRGLSVEIALPKSTELKIKTVSGDLQINQTVSELEIGSVSGDVTISQNPSASCTIKTVSGDIATHTFSACDYTLKSVSGDIKVYVAPDLNVEVDGNSISGDLNSEISLDETPSEPTNTGGVVRITTSTISGDFNLVRN